MLRVIWICKLVVLNHLVQTRCAANEELQGCRSWVLEIHRDRDAVQAFLAANEHSQWYVWRNALFADQSARLMHRSSSTIRLIHLLAIQARSRLPYGVTQPTICPSNLRRP